MPIVDGEFVPYDEWFPQDAPNRDAYDDYFMQYNKEAPTKGTPVVGYRFFYRAPYISHTKNIQPGRLYSVMAKGLHVDAVAAHGGASWKSVQDPSLYNPDDPNTFGEVIDPIANGLVPFEEGSPNVPRLAGDVYYMWPSREVAEAYMQSMLQAQQGIENKRNAATSFTYTSRDTISFEPKETDESAYMLRGHYELHRVTGIAGETKEGTAGWTVTDMMIDPEVLVDLRSDEPAISVHYNNVPPPIPVDAWSRR